MQNILKILVFATAVLLIACGKEKVNKDLLYRLDDIQAMGDSCPEKAIVRLDSIKPLFEEESEYMRNKFALLDIRLRDKAYITHTSDSTIKEVCKFFEEHGTAKELQETYYYMGSVYRDLNDYPRAVTYYLKAIETAEKSKDADPKIFEVSCLQLAGLYRKQFNYTEALNVILKGLEVTEKYELAKERTYMDVANSYINIDDTINAMRFYNISFNCVKKEKTYNKYKDVIANLMGSFAKYGNKSMADSCFHILEKFPLQNMPHNYLINLAIYQEHCISTDSAAATRLLLLNGVNGTVSLYNASRWLTRHYISKGEYKTACKYAIKFLDANEALIKERDFDHTTNAKNIFQYQRDKEEEQRIMLENEKRGRTVIITTASAIIIVLLLILFYFIRRKQILARLVEMNSRIDTLKSDIAYKEKILKEKEKETENRSKELYEMNEIIVTLDRQHSAMAQRIKEQKLQNSDLMKMIMSTAFKKEDKEICGIFKEAAEGKRKLGGKEWERLYNAVNNRYPGFRDEIQQKMTRINETTLQLCYLLKTGLTNKEIENITGWPHQTVWYRIKRIEKIMQTDKISTQE